MNINNDASFAGKKFNIPVATEVLFASRKSIILRVILLVILATLPAQQQPDIKKL